MFDPVAGVGLSILSGAIAQLLCQPRCLRLARQLPIAESKDPYLPKAA